MNITCDQVQGRVPVTVVVIHGQLDGSNFQQLIASAQEAYAAGIRHMVVDMRDMSYMSSAGLVALHSIALLLSEQPLPDLENGWGAFHAVERTMDSGTQKVVKLLKPQETVERVLRTAGMDSFFEIYQDLATAVGSF